MLRFRSCWGTRVAATRRTRALGTLVVVLAGALLAILGVSAPAGGATPAPVSVSVGTAYVGPPVAAGFVGVATEYWDVEKEIGTDPSQPNVPFEQVLRNLAPYGSFNLRIGGDSTDWTWWPINGMPPPPWVKVTLSPTWTAVIKRLVDDVHAHLTLGINMEADSPTIANAEVTQLESHLGNAEPITFEIGNEPELYSKFTYYNDARGKGVLGRPKGYSYADITAQWDKIAGALGHVRLAGPGYSGLSALPYAGQFLGATHKLSVLTVHTYPLKSKRCNGGTNLQESDLFDAHSLQDLASQLSSWTSLAHHYGVGVRVDEMNSVTCGGTPQFSGTFGPALWALNILPLYAETGATGVNFQTKPDTAQNLIQTVRMHSGWQAQVQPEYYGMMAFAQLTPPGSRLLRVSAMPAGLYAWAVRTPQGKTHVVVTNVNASATAVAIKGGAGPATLEALTAGSGGLNASGDVTLGGQTVSPSTGQLTGRLLTTTVRPSQGAYQITIPAASAEIVTFKR
jgi:hypothetical protein